MSDLYTWNVTQSIINIPLFKNVCPIGVATVRSSIMVSLIFWWTNLKSSLCPIIIKHNTYGHEYIILLNVSMFVCLSICPSICRPSDPCSMDTFSSICFWIELLFCTTQCGHVSLMPCVYRKKTICKCQVTKNFKFIITTKSMQHLHVTGISIFMT